MNPSQKTNCRRIYMMSTKRIIYINSELVIKLNDFVGSSLNTIAPILCSISTTIVRNKKIVNFTPASYYLNIIYK